MCTAVSSGAANEMGIGERRVDRARLRSCCMAATARPTVGIGDRAQDMAHPRQVAVSGAATAGPCGSADGAAEYFFDADASGTDERRHRVVSLNTQLVVLGFLGLGPMLAVAVLFREIIEFKGQLPEIH